MAKVVKIYYLKNTIEVEKVHITRRRGDVKNSLKKLKTTKAMELVNERHCEDKLRRTMNNNFSPGDWHLVLTYSKAFSSLSKDDRAKALRSFFGKMKRRYKKLGHEFKWITVTEYKNGNPHHHIVINEIPEINVKNMVTELWKYGRPHFTPLDKSGDYAGLAYYFIKETRKTFRNDSYPHKQRYTCSRNMDIPVPKVKKVSGSRFVKDPKSFKGYFVVPDSVRQGVCQFNGYTYQYYTMAKLGSPIGDYERAADDSDQFIQLELWDLMGG